MYKNVALLLLALMLSSCTYLQIHRPEIEQGNVITPEEVHSLHTGMSEDQVKNVMGTPVLVNVFTPHRIEYVYTFQLEPNPRVQKRVTCVFVNGRLQEILR